MKRFILGLAAVILSLGFSRASSYGGFLPDVLIITVWLLAWLTSPKIALSTTLMIGLILDVVLFMPIGFWTISLLSSVGLILYLKIKFLDSSNIFHALAGLLICLTLTVFAHFIIGARFKSEIIINYYIVNLVFGSFLFYFLSLRFKLFQHWSGELVKR